MKRTRIALLNAAHNSASTRRNFRRELDAELVEYDVNDGHLPDDVEFDAIVVTGSRSSVYWDDPWIQPLIDYVADAAARGTPVLGVCYGHQVLAEALGGRVAGMDDFELGYTEVRHRGDELFDGIDEEFTVFTSHGDAVVSLPDGAEMIAENEYGIHAFRNDHCWGVQFHPEYDTRTAAEVAEGKRDQVGDRQVDAVLEGITEENFQAACEAKTVFDNFVQYVEDTTKEPNPAADPGVSDD
jgi:GMP synthase - Glutamine amidotransferase domain